MLATGFEDTEVEAGTHVMFDCHGTIDLYCWDGGKCWVVDGEPANGDAQKWAAATSAVWETLLAAMKPGTKVRDLQSIARDTYHKSGVTDPDRALIFFYGLDLSHMEPELTTSSGERPGGNWRLEEGMVALIDFLYPGSEHYRSWCEEVVEICADGGKPMFSRGPDPLVGSA